MLKSIAVPSSKRHSVSSHPRRGIIVVLAALMIVMLMAFMAFSIDVGYITVTKAELQKSSDASVLAAALEMPPGLGLQATKTVSEIETLSRQAAVDVAAANRGGGLDAVFADGTRDVRFGQVTWDPVNDSWVKSWGTSPYNLVEVTLRRDQSTDADGNANSGGDRPLSLFFAPVIGTDTAGVSSQSTAAVVAGSGFRIVSGSQRRAGLLPIALDEDTWNALVTDQAAGSSGQFSDTYAYNEDTGAISVASDGKFEVNLYPEGTTILPPGNRGTVDIGSSSNSTSDLVRQILYGLNEDDLSYFGGEIKASYAEPLILNGDTGISAGMKDELHAIRGTPRAIPIFSQVQGPGNNAMYTIVKFVGIRIMKVKLTGNPKYVMVQMAPFTDQTVTWDGTETVEDSYIFSAPTLIQ